MKTIDGLGSRSQSGYAPILAAFGLITLSKIVGGAFFVRHPAIPLDLAWRSFGEANDMSNLQMFRRKV